jgi:hypothetical protein
MLLKSILKHLTDAGDAQKTFDLLGSKEKELLWIKNTRKRFRDGCNYFGRHPEKIIIAFDMHMK